jgi:RNase P subunit RPR2
MIRVAGERIGDLFALAESESRAQPTSPYPNRYVGLARRIGMRYTVRLPPEYRERYCRHCSSFWVEGRTVRTRLRAGHRVQTCLVCGVTRRQRYRGGRRIVAALPTAGGARPQAAEVMVDLDEDDSMDALVDDGQE